MLFNTFELNSWCGLMIPIVPETTAYPCGTPTLPSIGGEYMRKFIAVLMLGAAFILAPAVAASAAPADAPVVTKRVISWED